MISAAGNQKHFDGSVQVSPNLRSIKTSLPQEIRSPLFHESLRSQHIAMYQDKLKNAKIIALQRRFSSCGNLGKQLNSSEGDLNSSGNHVSSMRSSSFPKAPHFISSLYHSVDRNKYVLHNPKFVHSSSVELPSPTFNSKRLRSGSCPQVWTSIKLGGQVSLHNTLLSSDQNMSALNLNERKDLTNSRKGSVPCFEKLHAANFFHDKSMESFDKNKKLRSGKSAQNISFGSSDPSLAVERSETIYSDTFSSYEDLNEQTVPKNDFLHQGNSNLNKFSLVSSLKRTASSECFSLPCGLTNKYGGNFPCQAGLQKFVKNSFYSNSDIYDLKSPMDIKSTLKKSPCGTFDNAQATKVQDPHVIYSKKVPNLTKTFSDQQLSSPQISRFGHLANFNEDRSIFMHNSFDKKCHNSSSQNSVYVSSVFLNLSNSHVDKHESRHSSASFPNEYCSFSKRPSTLCLQQIDSDSRSKLPSSASNYTTKKHVVASSNAQKENFDALLRTIKEAVYQKDLLQNDVKQMESTLTKNRQVLLRMEVCPAFIQELRRNNFILKSKILRLTQFLEIHSEGNISNSNDDGRESFSIADYYNNQKWSYNPSYNGRH